MRCWLIICAFLIGFRSVPLVAQQFSLRQYTVVDGLPQLQVNVVTEDANGYLWIGTHGGGLARFDGKEFKVYTTRDGLLSNIIHFIKIDSQSNLWIVHPRGISRYDGLEFKKFNQPDSNTTLRRVRRIFEHRDTVYLVNGQGMLGAVYKDSLHYWSKPANQNKIILYTHLMPNRDVCLYLNDSTLLIKSKTSDYVVSHKKYFNRTQNIFNFDGKMWFLTDLGYFWFDPSDKTFYKGKQNLKNYIIQYDTLTNNFWTRSELDLLKEYESEGVHQIDTVLNNISVTQILTDSEGNTWFGTAGNGLYKYFIQDFDRCASKSLTDVKAITKDKNGVSWIGVWPGH
ncbi:MAG: hypothetical protein HC811_10995, partial [Flammeovirgaceae bacterium]|nr:hypothetical protein [Flammeovirgaceae bacterium]